MKSLYIHVANSENYEDNITGKRILLVCQEFFGYEKKMQETLLAMGAKEVYWQDVKWFLGSFRDKITWKSPYYYLKNPHGRSKWTEANFQKLGNKVFDVLLCIENVPFKKWYIKCLTLRNPQMKTVLFLWDTLKEQGWGFKDYYPLFDRIYSFDRDDCQKYGFEYFPDFYIEDNKQKDLLQNEYYDLAFVSKCNATSTMFRGELLAKIDDFCIENGLKTFFHLRYFAQQKKCNPIKKLIQKIFSSNRKYYRIIKSLEERQWLQSYDLPLDLVEEAYNKSKVILDLNYHNRQGMTLNCIASIAKGKKLITANKRISEESFYDPNNILIIEETNPILSVDFFKSKPSKIDISELRLDNWLRHIING